MKKKLLLVALMAGTMALSATAFTACGGKYSETFEGAVSENSYETTDKAAAGFVEEELSGRQSRVELTEYKKEKVLTNAEVTALNISEQDVGGKIESVEKGKVTYKESASGRSLSAAVAAATEDEESVHVVTLYIITYTKTGASVKSYKYYAPLPEKGEALSVSYYKSVLDGKKYENCTVKTKMNTSESATYDGKTESYTMSAEYVMSLNVDKAYIEYKASMPDDDGNVNSVTMSMYLVDSVMGVKCAASTSGASYVVVPLSTAGLHVSSISELYSSQLTDAQCSLFVKTNYGFKLKDDTLKNLFGGSGSPDVKFDGKCEYYVTEGRISKEVMSVSMSMSDPDEGSMSMKANAECNFSEFGSTTVTVPDEVKTLLGIN